MSGTPAKSARDRSTTASSRRKRKQGSVYRRASDGRWVAALRVRNPYTGEERTATAYCDTEPEAERVLAAMIVERDAGLPVGQDGGRIEPFLQKWLTEVVKPSVRLSTYRHYEAGVRLHILPYFRKYTLREVTPQHVHDWQRALARKGATACTVRYVRGILLRAFKHALAWDLVIRNPVEPVPAPRHRPKEMKVWTPAEARTFLEAMQARSPSRYAWYAVALYLGLRLGEMTGLRWEDVDLERSTMYVRAQLGTHGEEKGVRVPVKTTAGLRKLEMPRTLVAALRAHRRAQLQEIQTRAEMGLPLVDSGYVFQNSNGKPQLHITMEKRFIADMRGLEVRRIRFHDLRHTFASLAYSRGVPIGVISKMLGHSNLRVTMTVYTHIFDEAVQSAAERMDELFGAGGG